MTNEQVAVLITQYRSRLSHEIDTLENELVDLGVPQHTDRVHKGGYGESCQQHRGFLGISGGCTNLDHFEHRPNGSVECLDRLRVMIDDLDGHIAILQPREQAEV